MTNTPSERIAPGRLPPDEIGKNFCDLHPLLDANQARIAADRCYFCHDAPCTIACPTSIDIPLFIREISTGNLEGAAETILSENIFGGMCARVCPTETLCEEACVRTTAGEEPVEIGPLQRVATDHLMASGKQLFTRGPESGKRIAVAGAGPAGLSCAHRLAMLGHAVTVFDAASKPGGLNEFGLAAYKTVDDFAQREIDFILGIGGIEIKPDQALGREFSLAGLMDEYDAVFLGMGLGDTNQLGIEGEDLAGVEDAVDYISRLRQADDLSRLPVGRSVIVIGGGMTAIDIAVQTKKLGAAHVAILYRRGPESMSASAFEQELAQTNGVVIRQWTKPVALEGEDGHLTAVTLESTHPESNGEKIRTEADQLFKAIGQKLVPTALEEAGIALEGGRITVDDRGRTSLPGVWAGGDCVAGGNDLTVSAVEDGKRAAHSINQFLRQGG